MPLFAFTLRNTDIGSLIGLPDVELTTVIFRVIQLALGALPLITVIFLILGGLQWMTSAGDEEKLDRAKRTISSAMIGLVVVLMAWAIVHFFVGTTLNVTSNTNSQ